MVPGVSYAKVPRKRVRNLTFLCKSTEEEGHQSGETDKKKVHRIKERIVTILIHYIYYDETRLPGYRLEPIVSLLEGLAKGFGKGFAKGFAKRIAKGFAKRFEVCKGFLKGLAKRFPKGFGKMFEIC